MLLKAGRDRDSPAHVVGMVRQPETVEVANFLIDKMGHGVLTAELLQPDELVSGIIAQVRPLMMPCTGSVWAQSAPGLPYEGLSGLCLEELASGVDSKALLGRLTVSLQGCTESILETEYEVVWYESFSLSVLDQAV